MQSELNRKLFAAIDNSDEWDYYFDGEDEVGVKTVDKYVAANECEKIALQAQIDLLKRVKVGLIQRGVIEDLIKEIEEQLNQLK